MAKKSKAQPQQADQIASLVRVLGNIRVLLVDGKHLGAHAPVVAEAIEFVTQMIAQNTPPAPPAVAAVPDEAPAVQEAPTNG